MQEIVVEGEKLQLLPQRAIYWQAKSTLVISDLHWGKTAHFRKHGIAIPLNTQQGDEIRLANIIKELDIKRLIIAGDFFHSKANKETESFAHWREMHRDLHIDLIIGNHDILSRSTYEEFNIVVHEEQLKEGPFLITHDCSESDDGYCIHGHLHPALTISRRGHRRLKLPCYCIDNNRMILPAFGSFTGNYKVKQSDHKHLYVIADSEVIQWK